MEIRTGQRYRWIYSCGRPISDLILEVTSWNELRIVQVIKEYGDDHPGKKFDVSEVMRYSKYFQVAYLEGQDAPEGNDAKN